jgi:peptidoglycan/xylan/chitin deacetylase (PgdA/CDA1 family)
MNLIPEFHDISVWNFETVAAALQEPALARRGKWRLMVVPCLDGAGAERAQGFREQLAAWKGQGHALCLHGLRHKSDPELARSLVGKLILKLTNGEAEFAGLSEADSGELLRKAVLAWNNLGVGEPKALVPPTWHANAYLPQQARDLGFEFYGGRLWSLRLADGEWKREFSVPFSFAGIPGWVACLAKVAARVCEKLPAWGPAGRLVLHPGEVKT